MRYLFFPTTQCELSQQLYTACRPKIKEFLCLLITLFVLLLFCDSTYASQHSNFPEYSVIKDNVRFWEKIYSHYSKNDAVVHDRDNLSIIYETIPLVDAELPGAARINKLVRLQTAEKYQKILLQLSKTGTPRNQTEKRVYNLFKGKNKKRLFATAADNIRIQTGLKEQFEKGVSLSGQYIPEIKKIFKSHGLPIELAYLPHVESSFDNSAHSSAGAQGIWQFTKTTGKQYLRINSNIDERRDPVLAAEAAARYLKNSYQSLENWPLALTSYNYGLAGMMRAVKAEGGYDKIFANYQEGHFKFASRNFYSEFLAAYKVARKIELDTETQLYCPLQSNYLTLKSQTSLASLGRHFKLPTRVLAELNPALLSPIITGGESIPAGYRIRLPHTNLVAKRLHSLPKTNPVAQQLHKIPNNDEHKKLTKRSHYIVKRGDTVHSIAAKHKISLAKLLKVNNLDRTGKIYTEQKLKLP